MVDRSSRRFPRRRSAMLPLLAAVLALVTAVAAGAIEPPDPSSPVAARAMRHPDLWIAPAQARPAELTAAPQAAAFADLAALGADPASARLDVRSGRWETLLSEVTLLPALTVGAPPAAQPPGRAALEQAAWSALAAWIEANGGALRIDPAELVAPGRVTVHSEGELIQVHVPRVVDGIPVRDSYLTAVINHGSLVLFGASRWGDVDVSTSPALDVEAALAALDLHLGETERSGLRARPRLELLPLTRGRDAALVVPGQGYAYRLVWVLAPAFAGELGSWEALLDAHTGELLAFEDRNQYAATQREVKGGVYPVSNDGAGADGTEQAGWPMPFAEIATPFGFRVTDRGGNAPVCIDGAISSKLSGPYIRMDDLCGSISLSGTGNLDFGTSGGTDCSTPGFGGAGNTHASRTGFHELNRIREQAKGQLPGNAWLDRQLAATMNIDASCNAFWNGFTVNFYRETFVPPPPAPPPSQICANTGELAGVFDHEWGHGMDDNDANPSISRPGEGIADLYTYFRLDTSCIGRGFRPGVNCGGYGDPCTSCTGVREIDWAKRTSAAPHDVVWADSACGSGSSMPCGGSTHCEGQVYAEAVYDLVERDLPSLFGMDHNTAFEVGTRLTYLGGGGVGTWFQCDVTGPDFYGGCAATSGYQQFLAADDDDGNLSNGTPHMSAIFAAFDRHGIACDTPAVVDSGCAGTPATAPVVTATPRDRGVDLSWGAVAGATKYQVFRTDGVHACAFGKTKIGETTDTSFSDRGLQNGRATSYVVIPIGPADTCIGPASACQTATPAAGPNLGVDPLGASLAFVLSDGDAALDNCELATASFDVHNLGDAAQTNVRIKDVRSISHPGVTIQGIDPVVPDDLAVCGTGSGGFDLFAQGLAAGDTVLFEVDLTSDELFPAIVTRALELSPTESDLQFAASKLWDFESDLDGWTVLPGGTFSQATTGGGAGGSAGYLASSNGQTNSCDRVQSPPFLLKSTSTLSLSTNYEIEEIFGSTWYDRANVGLFDAGLRRTVAPDSGRPYNASGGFGYCETAASDGWAGNNPVFASWATSSWSSTALDTSGLADRPLQLDVVYGSDFVLARRGFWFDQVTLTDVDLLVADGQSDVCGNTPPTVLITQPPDEALFDDDDLIGFTGSASDAEDGDLTASLAWTSDIDGSIGSGGSFSTTLSAGFHTVTAAVTDSGGLGDQETRHLLVTACPTHLVEANKTITGPATLEGHISVTLGPNLVIDGVPGAVDVEAGSFIAFENDVELGGTVSLILTPNPCD